MELEFLSIEAVRQDGVLKLCLELSQNLLGLVHGPVDAVHLVGVGPVVEHVLGPHQLDHGLESAGLADVARLVLLRPAHDQLLRPVHVAGREPVTSSGQLRSDVRNTGSRTSVG